MIHAELELEGAVTEIDVPLMRKVFEHIEAHPEQHDQDHWGKRTECGTVACFAGWTVQLAGGELRFDDDGEASLCRVPDTGGSIVQIEEAARHLLGLDEDQADEMFWDSENLDDLWERAERFTGGELRRP